MNIGLNSAGRGPPPIVTAGPPTLVGWALGTGVAERSLVRTELAPVEKRALSKRNGWVETPPATSSTLGRVSAHAPARTRYTRTARHGLAADIGGGSVSLRGVVPILRRGAIGQRSRCN